MELDLHTKQHLANLLAKPVMVSSADTDLLSDLVKKYPYYQPLHLLLAKANANDSTLATAALYNGGALLHQVIYQTESLITSKLNLVPVDAIKADENQTYEQIESVEDLELAETLTDEQETFEEITEIKASPVTEDKVETEVEDEVDEEVYEEIAELNITPAVEPEKEEEKTFEEIAEVDTAAFVPVLTKAQDEIKIKDEVKEESLPDQLAIESIVASDFFAFEKSFTTEVSATPKSETKVFTHPEEYDQEAEAQTVSKYDDDKLPYTFLWWLAKTRAAHEQIFQPYVTPKKTNNTPAVQGELQQQYVEHIFHLQTPFNIADEANKGPLNKQIVHKGTDIIDSFIKNEPQIRPPKAEQINNENKAKKSAEDHNDLVSETLAAIYIEQTLYHKAIDTYEKLSLKFPEKSRYFADLIQSLEKKI
ncbi:hypothetical protein EZ428_00925 [Pedobacter frigiditerrae]|uniref:Tetratricopeptide repeat protein n=1 Tax=Pedobacter frigiditerrae TaxID=2530452 RepID=A0A4R0N124_9SPHI|nr:hypothetical protein [Pedobacter frigiditerrae]TCC93365.1 hypothetical protein EZ428_00925 [Pedobacter frigiditerrae]